MERNNRIEDILNSLDGTGRAEAGPYFYSRLRARMEEGLLPRPIARRLALALAIVVVLNLITLKYVQQGKESDAGANAIVSEYSLNATETY